jgi:hypothetical protein
MTVYGKLEDLSGEELQAIGVHLDGRALSALGAWYEAAIAGDVDEKRDLEREIVSVCEARRSLRVEVAARVLLEGEGDFLADL